MEFGIDLLPAIGMKMYVFYAIFLQSHLNSFRVMSGNQVMKMVNKFCDFCLSFEKMMTRRKMQMESACLMVEMTMKMPRRGG
jgi:hypothetical protein